MKKRTILAASLALAVLLTACSDPRTGGPPETAGVPEDTGAPSAASPPETREGQPERAERPSHITRELTEGVRVDADVTYPERPEYGVLSVECAGFDAELLKEIFLGNDSSPAEEDRSGGLTITTRQGSRITSRCGRVVFDAADGKICAALEDLLRQFAQDNGNFNGIDLPFMSREDALDLALSAVEELDMPGTPEVTAFVGLDQEALDGLGRRLTGGERYEEAPGRGRATELKGLTEVGGVYYIRAGFRRSDLPFYNENTEWSAEFAGERVSTSSAYVEALITPAGLAGVTVEGCFVSVSGRMETRRIVSLETVLSRVKEKYELQIVPVPVIFTRIYMEYMILRETTGRLKIVPYWVLEYGCAREDGVFQLAGAERFNAVTGEDLACGG